MRIGGIVLALCLAGAATGVQGAVEADPDWPCVQRKVEHLSVGVMWPHPIPEASTPLPPDLDDLAAALALRRVSLDEAQKMIDAVAEASPDLGLDAYGQVFRAAFERIDRQRSRIVQGIGRYAHNQARLSEELDALRAEMAALEAADEPDFDRMDEVETEMDWRERVFDDRNRSLTYVCETPILLEKRAYAIAQMLLAKVE